MSSACDSVANAAAPSDVTGPSQNLRRDLRTYQLDRSSMNRASRRPAVAGSNASSAVVTSRTTRFSSLSSQRSSTGRPAGGGAGALAAPPCSAAVLAYRIRNETVFQ